LSTAHTDKPGEWRLRGRQLLALGLIAFYLLASARAFVPGMCATLVAAQAQLERDAGRATESRDACCSMPRAEHTREQDAPTPVSPVASGCPFCSLVQALAPLPAYVQLPLPAVAIRTAETTTALRLPAQTRVRLYDGRAPPA